MTALMVLFLIVMTIALINVKVQADKLDAEARARSKEAKQFKAYKKQDEQNRLRLAAQKAFRADLQKHLPEGVRLRGDLINWGDKMLFEDGSSALSPTQQAILRKDIAPLLAQATGPLGTKVLKRFIVEGFASNTGTYLFNLNLSLDRSQRVICSLLDESPTVGQPLTPLQRQQVVDLFLISGYSSNDTRKSEAASRRVELRLEWWGDRPDETTHPSVKNVGSCGLGG